MTTTHDLDGTTSPCPWSAGPPARFRVAGGGSSAGEGRSGDRSVASSILAGPAVRSLRRAFLALGVTGLIAAVLRLRGTGGVPPQTGGWRELSGPELR